MFIISCVKLNTLRTPILPHVERTLPTMWLICLCDCDRIGVPKSLLSQTAHCPATKFIKQWYIIERTKNMIYPRILMVCCTPCKIQYPSHNWKKKTFFGLDQPSSCTHTLAIDMNEVVYSEISFIYVLTPHFRKTDPESWTWVTYPLLCCSERRSSASSSSQI